MFLIDLHTHSTYSDGTCDVDALVRRAKARHVSILSLTDHDTTEGVPLFLKECEKCGLKGVSGVELSAEADYTLHLLGYRYRLGAPELEEPLERIRHFRDRRNDEIVSLLQRQGIDITLEKVNHEAGGKVLARPHFARALVKMGIVPDVRTAFRVYLGRGGSAYVWRTRMSPKESIEAIVAAGGLAVLAHPILTGLTDAAMDLLLEELKSYGLWGLECLSLHHTTEQIWHYLRVADRHSLYTTAGSDFHGDSRHSPEIGIPVSEDFLPWARLGITL